MLRGVHTFSSWEKYVQSMELHGQLRGVYFQQLGIRAVVLMTEYWYRRDYRFVRKFMGRYSDVMQVLRYIEAVGRSFTQTKRRRSFETFNRL